MSVQRIHHYSITAPAPILDAMVKFYGDLLGLTPGPRPDFGINGYWLYANDEPILHLIEDPNRDNNAKGYFDHIALRCDHIEGILERLEKMDTKYDKFDIRDVNQTQIFLQDPAGISLELNFQN
ncbi:MAG: VOC family protein [Pseudomonadales bacterium]